jgi:hypothetical protein
MGQKCIVTLQKEEICVGNEHMKMIFNITDIQANAN